MNIIVVQCVLDYVEIASIIFAIAIVWTIQ